MALDDKKLPEDLVADPAIAADIRPRLKDGMLSCTAAFDSASALAVAPAKVGRTADALRLRLTECQIGLFGFPGHAKGWAAAGVAGLAVPTGLEQALRSALGPDGAISCLAIWRAAEAHGVSRMQAGYVADRLGLCIRHCQLGAF